MLAGLAANHWRRSVSFCPFPAQIVSVGDHRHTQDRKTIANDGRRFRPGNGRLARLAQIMRTETSLRSFVA
jgi:hypothetical protein